MRLDAAGIPSLQGGEDVKVLFGPIGLIKHGKNVDILPGTPLTAHVGQGYRLLAAK